VWALPNGENMTEELNVDQSIEDITTEDGYHPQLLEIVTYPNDLLHAKSTMVDEERFGSEELKHLIYDMFYTMKVKGGVGLAAVQVGRTEQLIVLSLEEPVVLINPKMVAMEGEQVFEEGCLSVPGFFNDTTRAEKIRIVYRDEEGTDKELTAEGLTAVCIQHEMDHLDGKLFVDELSVMKRMRVRKKVEKTLKEIGR